MKTRIMLFIVMLLAAWQGATAQDYFKDTVWTKRTDQLQGFYMVKFSNTDSLIVGHGMEMDLFYDAKTGQEVMRIPFNAEVHFINNDRNFIRLAPSRKKLEIWDTKTYQVIDSLESDSIETGSIDVSIDERFIAGVLKKGIRTWSLETKKIINTLIFPIEPNLIDIGLRKIKFTCDGNKLIGQFGKTYQDPNHPGDPEHYKSYGSFTVYDFNTLDSIDAYPNSRNYLISKTCKYIAYGTGDPTYGVEIYDFKTKELIWKLPINGPSLTGIEFSPDDMYLVTTNWTGDYGLKIWELAPKKMIYNNKDGGFTNFDISQNGKYLITSIVRKLYLYPMKYNDTSIPQKEINDNIIIFPNPSNGIATIEFNQPLYDVTTIKLIDTNGKIAKLILKKYLESGNQSIQFKTHDLLNGSYFISVENSHISLMFKLIVNR